MAILVCESGADKRRIFFLKPEKAVCGRGKDVEIPIPDPFASSRHFAVSMKNNSWYVEDLDSVNGIEINDAKVGAAKLEHGDLIRAGSTSLRLDERDESADEASHEGLPVIQGYEIIERIGVGGMGEVYRARQCSLDREVALKTLSPAHAKDREFVEKFFREARSAGNLNHPNIVQVHDVGESNGVCYICMEYVGGGDLTGLLREKGPLSAAETVRIITEVARGLELAEQRGIVHCDIKPDNIMFTESGIAKIADLGIARSASGYQERKKEVFGSPHYMAPEQAMGKPVDHRADLYALGCTMFRMLAGRTPFTGNTAREVMKKQVVEEHPDIMKLVPDCPARLADIVDYLMEKKPDERCKSATELIKLLELVLSEPPRKSSKKVRRKGATAPQRTVTGSHIPVSRIPRQGSSSGLVKVFTLALVVGVVLILGKVFLLADDPALRAFNDSVRLQKEGDINQAISVLRAVQPRVTEEEMQRRINERLTVLEALKAAELPGLKFQRFWNEYIELRASGASREMLEKRLDYLAELYDGQAEQLRIISAERVRLITRRGE